MEQPSARVVFAVTLQGTARKLVTVRSALMINNRLPDPVEIKMESAVHRIGGRRQRKSGGEEQMETGRRSLLES